MSNKANIFCKPVLFIFLLTGSLYSTAQELDSLKSSKKVLDRLELETTLSVYESEKFNSMPGVGAQLALYAPFYDGALRLGLGIGFSKLSYAYDFDKGHHHVLGISPPYSSQLDAYPLNVDLTLGTDLLRNSPMDLTIDVGARMYVPLSGAYSFDYDYYNYPSHHSLPMSFSVNPAAVATVSFKYPFNERSALTVSYGFSYAFLTPRPKANSESNGFHYRSDLVDIGLDNRLEDNIVGIVLDPGLDYFDMLVLELPSSIGGQHSISIGYRHSFGIGKKAE